MFFLPIGISPGETVLSRGQIQVAAAFAVDLREGDANLVHRTLQGASQRGKIAAVEGGIGQIREDNGIITPDHRSAAILPGQGLDIVDCLGRRQHRWFQGAGIARDGVLHHEWRRQDCQIVPERQHIPAPKDEAIDVIAPQRDPIRPAAIGVGDHDVTQRQPLCKPGGIKGRNIRAV